MRVTAQNTTLFGTAAAWPLEQNPDGKDSILALEVGSIWDDDAMHPQVRSGLKRHNR